MLFTLGKIFFPTLLHREKALRARMRWVAVIFGSILVIGVIGVIIYIQKTRPGAKNQGARPLKVQTTP